MVYDGLRMPAIGSWRERGERREKIFSVMWHKMPFDEHLNITKQITIPIHVFFNFSSSHVF